MENKNTLAKFIAINKCNHLLFLRHFSTSKQQNEFPHLSPTDPCIHQEPSAWNTLQPSSLHQRPVVPIWRSKNALHDHYVHEFQWGLKVPCPRWKARPTKAYIHKDYFLPPAENIRWDDLNEQWEVYWYDGIKLNAKPFPIRFSGLDRSKKKATEFADIQRKLFHGKELERPERYSNHPNVHYDEILQAWGSIFYQNGRPTSRYYTAGAWGYETGRRLALRRVTTALIKSKREHHNIRKLFHR